MNCAECEDEVVEQDDFLCYTCRLIIDNDIAENSTIIYHGDMHRGNILRCSVVEWRDKDRLRDKGMLLALPREFSANSFIWTKEKWFRCGCGELAISHWPEPECAICAGAQVFPWAKKIV